MSNLKFKSDQNLSVAQFLINNKQYNPSIHCSYYGCFQFMKHLICHKLKIDYATQNSKKGPDSHDYIFELILNEINNSVTRRNFRTNFKSLKDKRKNSDYNDYLITEDESLTAIEEANRIISNLKQALGNIKV